MKQTNLNEWKKCKWLKEVGSWVAIVACILFVRYFILSPVRVYGASMEPNYHTGDRLWESRFMEAKRFDIVTFPSPKSGSKVIKRVIGLPGDTVEMKDDQLYVNDEKILEPFLDEYKEELKDSAPFTDDFSLKNLLATEGVDVVPEGYYFILGDNRPNSEDSRIYGYVPKDSIEGVVYFRYYPLDKIGLQ